MNVFMSLYVAALFVALTPGVLLTLPKGGARLTVAVVHGLVFAVIYNFTYRMVWRNSVTIDGFAIVGSTFFTSTGLGAGQTFTSPLVAYQTGVCSMSPFLPAISTAAAVVGVGQPPR